MRTLVFWLIPLVVSVSVPTSVGAQNRCVDTRLPPFGTYPACGMAPGYYRPQPYTLRDRRVVPTPGSWYAPSGPRQRSWNQYDARSGNYGPREPNPFDERGRLSIPRASRHIYETRIAPRLRRNR
jgi:hypothetical protein